MASAVTHGVDSGAAVPTTGAGAARPGPSRKRIGLGLVGLTLALALAALASLMVGAEPIAPHDVVSALAGDATPTVTALFWDYRVPRTVVAAVIGAALGAAGALIQAFTRNPLADPGLLGVNAGAALAVTLTVSVAGIVSTSALIWPALVGALVSTVAVLLLSGAGRGPATPVRMTLAGVALAAVLGGITVGVRLADPLTFDRMRAWLAGSVAGRNLDDLLGVGPYIVIGLVVAVAVARPLNALAMGDDLAGTLGVNIRAVRTLTVLAVALLLGSAIAVAGPIGFVGLMVPHACRLVVGNDQSRIVPLSVLAAPVVLLVSDVISRLIIPGREVPVGVVTAFVGAPVLIALITRRKAVGM